MVSLYVRPTDCTIGGGWLCGIRGDEMSSMGRRIAVFRRTRAMLGVITLGMVLVTAVRASPSDGLLQKVRAFRAAHASEILREFVQLLAIPNVASDRPNIRRNADAIALMLER